MRTTVFQSQKENTKRDQRKKILMKTKNMHFILNMKLKKEDVSLAVHYAKCTLNQKRTKKTNQNAKI